MSIVERIASERYVDEKALYEANKAIENLKFKLTIDDNGTLTVSEIVTEEVE